MKKILKITCKDCKEVIFEDAIHERPFSDSELATLIETHKITRHSDCNVEYEKPPKPPAKQTKVESKTEVPSKKETKSKKEKKGLKEKFAETMGITSDEVEMPAYH